MGPSGRQGLRVGAPAAGGPWEEVPACAPDLGQAPAASSRRTRRGRRCQQQPEGASKGAGGAPAGPAAASRPSRTAPSGRARASEPTPCPLLPGPLRAPPSPPTPGWLRASIFQIFLEPAAPRAAVARALTEAAEAETRSGLGRGAAARVPPRRLCAQAQTSVTAGWRRRSRSEERPWLRRLRRGGHHLLRGCSTCCPRFNA